MKEYRRPLGWSWWLAKPAYTWFMVRELTALFVGGYAIFLLVLLYRAQQGAATLAAFVEGLRSPLAIVLHVLALAMALVHTVTWFHSTPKIVVFPRGFRAASEGVVIGVQYAIWVLLSLVVLAAVLAGE